MLRPTTSILPKISGLQHVLVYFSSHYSLTASHFLLDPAPFRRTATVVRNRRRVLNRTNVQAGRRQSPHRRLAPRPRTADPHIHNAHAVVPRLIGGVSGSLLRREGRALTRPAEAQRTRTLPRHRISVRIGDGNDRVIERGLNMHESVGNVLALLLLELLALAFFVRCGGSSWFRHVLCLPCRFLLIGYRALARTFPGASIGVSALSANRQAAAVPVPTIGADFDEPLDVHRDVLAEIAFDVATLFNHLANAVYFLFVEVADLLVGLHVGGAENAPGARIPDPENVGQGDADVLVARKIHACNTCHSCSQISD